MNRSVLLVDDEPNLLKGFQRHLRKKYDLSLAVGAAEAVKLFKAKGPFAVVVSDMQMPDVNGVELLAHLSAIDAQTTRIMLTGNADQRTAADAVNNGKIFRFLNKPCPPEDLCIALEAGIEQYRLVTAEAELLSKTVSGSVRMLSEVLSLAMPDAFGAAIETKRLARKLAEKLGVSPLWQIDMAAMLLRIGCVSLPESVLKDYLAGRPLNSEERRLVEEHPTIGHRLVSAIPKLESVADLILQHRKPLAEGPSLAAKVLRVADDFQTLRRKSPSRSPIETMQESGEHDPTVVSALESLLASESRVREATVAQLQEGMVLESHIVNDRGDILIAKGSEIHCAMLEKLKLFSRSEQGIREPIVVREALYPA